LINQQQPLLITIAAGIRLSDLSRWCNGYHNMIRSMPNTPALLQSGATALYADPAVSDANKDIAETVMRAVGIAIWVNEEAQMDAVTALSGSGPAYFFYVMQVMEQAGIELGLPEETARLLTLQTAFGAAKMAMESTDSPELLRAKVTSPGGTTEQALQTLHENGLQELFNKALHAAHRRSQQLAKEHGLQT
jgi:pyrroline-5-carboxylate reductase